MKWFYHQNNSHSKSSANPKPFIEDSQKTSSKFSASHPVDILTSYDFSPVNSFILPCDYSPGNWIRPFQEIWNSRRSHPDSGCNSVPLSSRCPTLPGLKIPVSILIRITLRNLIRITLRFKPTLPNIPGFLREISGIFYFRKSCFQLPKI